MGRQRASGATGCAPCSLPAPPRGRTSPGVGRDWNRLIVELRRRNVVRVAGLYGVVGWLLAQVAVIMETAFGLPASFDATVISLLLLGFPVALIVAWAFELTPEGVRRTDPSEPVDPVRNARKKRRLEAGIAVGLAALVAVFFAGRTTAPGAPPPDREASIAVLPFADMSAQGDQGYFGDGIAEELLNLLSRSTGLRVASRTSAFSFRDGTTPIREIGDSLDVAHVLEGSVRTAGPTVRITAQLIDTDTDLHLWSETYERPMSAADIFTVQDEIAASIVSELQGRLTDAPVAPRPTEDTEAYTAYLKAKAAAATRTVEGIETAIAEATKAVTLDPGFARAHAQLAYTYSLAQFYTDIDPARARELTQRHIERAHALAPDDLDVRLNRAWTSYAAARAPNATSEALFASLVEDDPTNAEAWRGLGMSRDDRAGRREAVERAAELDPRSTIILINLAEQRAEAGDVEGAVAVLERVLAVEPGNPTALVQLSYRLRDRGDLLEAHRVAKSAGDGPQIEEALRGVYFTLGMWEEAQGLGMVRAGIAEAVAEEDWKEARRLTGLLDPDDPFALPSHFITDDHEQMRKTLARNPGWEDYLLQDAPIRDYATAGAVMSYLRATRDRDPARAERLRARLEAWFGDPSTHRPASVSWNTLLARWHALNNRPREMDAALEARLALGSPLTSARFLEFRPHEGRAEMVAMRERSEELAERLRAAIRAELADPPEPWWAP